ncbi:MAG: hypothetical protein ACE5JF_08885 [Anaerolineales bacterium]
MTKFKSLASRAIAPARLAWVALTAMIVVLVGLGISDLHETFASTVDARSIDALNVTLSGYASYLTALFLLVVITHLFIGVIVFWRGPNDWMALTLAFALVSNGAWLTLSLMYPAGEVDPVFTVLVSAVTYVGLVSGISLLYVFPVGRFAPRWTLVMVVSWAILMAFAIFVPESPLSLSSLPILLQLLVLLIWTGVGLFAQLYRYLEISTPLQRQQTKWAISGLVLAVVGPFAYFLTFVIVPALSDPAVPNILYQRVGASLFALSLVVRVVGITVMGLATLIFPFSFVIAILRYRLWDIDVIINRTLVYGALTGTLILIYLFGVALLQSIFRNLTGQGDQLAIVATTLAIAALFNPLRGRIQAAIDRRFYRRRYDAARALATFSSTVQDEVELEDVSQALLRLVIETVQPSQSSLWLRDIGEELE